MIEANKESTGKCRERTPMGPTAMGATEDIEENEYITEAKACPDCLY